MTHINAYFQDVQDKEQAVKAAEAERDGAKQRLETKKREVGFEEPTKREPKVEPSTAPTSTKTSKKKK